MNDDTSINAQIATLRKLNERDRMARMLVVKRNWWRTRKAKKEITKRIRERKKELRDLADAETGGDKAMRLLGRLIGGAVRK